MSEEILTSDDLARIEDARRATLGDSIALPKVFRVGKIMPDGSLLVPVEMPEIPGQIWVRPQVPNSEAIPAVWTGEPIDEDSYVNIIWRGTTAIVDGFAPENAEFMRGVRNRPQAQ